MPLPGIRALTSAEEEGLRGAMSPADFQIVRFALATGLRRSDLFALRFQDFDPGSGTILPPPAKRPRTPLPLSSAAVEVLESRRAPDARPEDPVFGQADGGAKWLARVFRPARDQACPGLRFHDLRHTFAARLAAAGATMRQVQAALGHRSAAWSGKRYGRLSASALLAALNRLNAPGGGAAARD